MILFYSAWAKQRSLSFMRSFTFTYLTLTIVAHTWLASQDKPRIKILYHEQSQDDLIFITHHF